MTVFAPQGHRMFRRGSVKGCPAGEVLPRPGILVPLASEYPMARRGLHRPLAHKLYYVVLARTCCSVDIVRTIGGGEQVNMGVDETRQHCFAAQVYQFGMPVTDATHLIVVSHGQDTPAGSIDSHSLRPWLHGIHGIDCTVQIQYDAHRSQCLEIK